MALATPAEFVAMYRLQTVAGQDPAIATLITRADQQLAIVCGLPLNDSGAATLEASTYTLYPCRSSAHRQCLLVGMRLPTTVTTVHVSDVWTYDGTTLLSASDYAYETRSGELWLHPSASLGGWSRKPRANKVVLSSGFASGAAPESVKIAALTQARYLLELARLQGGDATSQAAGFMTPEQAEALLAPGVRDALMPYRYTADPTDEQPAAA